LIAGAAAFEVSLSIHRWWLPSLTVCRRLPRPTRSIVRPTVSPRATQKPKSYCETNSLECRTPSLTHLLRAALAGGFIDREVETKGLDLADREKAKYEG